MQDKLQFMKEYDSQSEAGFKRNNNNNNDDDNDNDNDNNNNN